MYPGRTTQDLILAIVVPGDVDPSITDYSPFIDDANELVTEVCGVVDTAGNNLYGYSAHRLLRIETRLAAHFLCITSRQASAQHAGPVGENTPAQLGLGLDNTVYGQQAKILDTAGALAVMENGQRKYALVPKGLAARISVGITALAVRCKRWW